MFQPVKELQWCVGASMVFLSLGGAWSMVSGSVVQFRVAGANFSVNQKLEKVEKIKQSLENTTTELKQQPGVSRRQIQRIEQQLQSVEPEIDLTEDEIHQDLDELGNRRNN